MSYQTTGVVLKTGISAAIQAGATGPQMNVAGFRIGSASAAEGATALETDTDVDSFVYAGDTSMLTYNQIDEDTLVWIVALPRSVGDFAVGNICITLQGGANLCKAVFSGQSPKYRDNMPAVVGNYKVYNIVMHLANAAGLINLSVLTANNASLPEVPTELDLPDPTTTPYNAYLVRNHTHIGQPCIAVRVVNAWTFSAHYDAPNAGRGIVAVSPTMFMSADAYGSKAALAQGAVGWNKTPKQFMAADGASLTEVPVGVRISSYQVVTLGMISGASAGVSGTLTPGTPYYAGTGANTGKLVTAVNGPMLAVAVSATDLYVDTTSLWRNSIASTIITSNFIEANSLFIDVTGDVLDVDLKPGSVVYAYMSGLNRVWSRADPLDDTNPIKLAVGVLNNDKKRVILAGLVKITAATNDLPGALTVGQVLACDGGADRGKLKTQDHTDSYIVGTAVSADTINVRFNPIASVAQHLLGARHDIVTTPYGVKQMIDAAVAGIHIPGVVYPLAYDSLNNRYYIFNADQTSLGVGRAATDLEVTNMAVAPGSNTPYPWITPQQIPIILGQVPVADPWGTGIGAIVEVPAILNSAVAGLNNPVNMTVSAAALIAGTSVLPVTTGPCVAPGASMTIAGFGGLNLFLSNTWSDKRRALFTGTWTVVNARFGIADAAGDGSTAGTLVLARTL